MENQPTIVTTNFDTLIERALLEKVEAESIRSLSFAGQDLPTPGSASFGGIIHLHGRIADQDLDLDETSLVVTSANYGDAYMRSGWASRFLFDLCRIKTIVLIGYSAGDAPFRYFLNVLEADRERFPDLRPVYALDAVDDRNEGDLRWSTLAVEPIPYEYVQDPETDQKSHSAMWRDLGKLADVVERPRSTRRAWAQDILLKKCATASQEELDLIKWLFADRRDLWSVAINAIVDPEWFEFFAQSKLWNDHDATWVIAAWVAQDFQSADNFKLAVFWLARLGTQFADEIDRRMRQAKDLPPLWLRAWRIFAKSAPDDGRGLDMPALSDAGQAELAAILQRREYLNRDVEDQDYFGSYSYGVRSVVGDPQPILEAPDEQRLEVAQKALSSQDIDKREGWRAYCSADPEGAFDTLSKAPLNEANSLLWRDFVNSLSSPNKELAPATQELILATFRTIESAPNNFLAGIIQQLSDLYTRAPRSELPDHEGWWSRLFAVSVEFGKEPENKDRDLYGAAINSPGGRLTEAVLIDIENLRKSDIEVSPWLVVAISIAAKATGWQPVAIAETAGRCPRDR
jgi:hypothetical protein